MKKVSVRTMKAILDEFTLYCEMCQNEVSLNECKKDLDSINNVIAILAVRDLLENDLAEQN